MNELANRMKQDLAELRRKMNAATGGRPLGVPGIDNPTKKLAESIEQHQAAVEALEAWGDELAGTCDQVAAMAAAPDADAGELLAMLQPMAGWKVKALVEARRLVLASEPTLSAIVELMNNRKAAAEKALSQARHEGKEKILASGFVPQAAKVGGVGSYPAAEQRSIDYEVERTAGVSAARAKATDAEARARFYREMLLATPGHAAGLYRLLAAELLASFRAL